MYFKTCSSALMQRSLCLKSQAQLCNNVLPTAPIDIILRDGRFI